MTNQIYRAYPSGNNTENFKICRKRKKRKEKKEKSIRITSKLALRMYTYIKKYEYDQKII